MHRSSNVKLVLTIGLILQLCAGVLQADPRPAPDTPLYTGGGVTLTQADVDRIRAGAQPRGGGSVLLVECTGSFGHATIQGAIDAAGDGDVVVVLPNYCDPEGRYFENIDFLGKAITVQSVAPANPAIVASTIIDGNQNGSVVTFANGEPPGAVLDGLTITNGSAEQGGGIYCTAASPTIANCMIDNNTAVDQYNTGDGGGIYCGAAGSPTIKNCTIVNNTTIGQHGTDGGGICCGPSSSPTITDCTIANNSSRGGGGGISCLSSSATITGCTIENNTAGYGGGGVYLGGGDATITNCTIRNNVARSDGGGIHCLSTSPTITSCTITKNTARGSGGGIQCHNGSPTIADCEIAGNTAFGSGGGLHSFINSSPTITHCTIANNMAYESGGGLYCDISSSPTITNSLIARNTAHIFGGGIANLNSGSTITHCTIANNTAYESGGGLHCSGSPTVTNCILWGDAPQEVYADSGTPVITYTTVEGGWVGEGNIDADPGFAFADDYHLMPGSVCIDAGTNAPPAGLPSDDLDGAPRPLDGDGDLQAVADMGAYEFDPELPAIAVSETTVEFFTPVGGPAPEAGVFEVRNSGGGTLNWEALEDCPWLTVDPPGGSSAGQINAVTLSVDPAGLAHGTHEYVVTIDAARAVNTPRTIRVMFHVHSTLHVPAEYGTIQEAIDATIVRRDVVLVADGIYTGPGNWKLNFGGKEIAVRSQNGAENCILDGADNRRKYYLSAFIFDSREGPESVVEGFTITNGWARYGGGIVCSGSSPTITDCIIVGNDASFEGGGIHCSYGSSPAIVNCTIVGNSARSGGGVYCTDDSRPRITNCTISDNRATHGGGIYCSESSPTIVNCIIANNTPFDTFNNLGRGGGIHCASGTPTITGCTIENNRSFQGGGIYCASGTPMITNCTITNNIVDSSLHRDSDGGGIYCASGSPTITNCIIANNTANPSARQNSDGGGIYCASGTPTITNCTIVGNTASTSGGLYCATDSSPTITNCILWNDSPPEIYVDSGLPTITYSNIEGGWAGEGNIDTDPAFAFTDDYHLMPGSACIDAGTNTPAAGLPPDDLDGAPRPLDGDGDLQAVADMGAHEFDPELPAIALSKQTAKFIAPVGGPAPEARVLDIRNSGGGILNWEALEDCPWLVVDPPSGSSDGQINAVTFSVDPTGLAHGEYECVVAINDFKAVNTTRTVRVVVYVYSTFHVPAEYKTIQEAIDATSVKYDVVLVADGTYTGPGNRDLDFQGKEITVRSQNGAENCIIDCENSGRGFYFHSGENSTAVVQGFTITRASAGAGIFCFQSSPTITNCIISNSAGAGIFCGFSSPTITSCTISNCAGTGIACSYSSATITNCTITHCAGAGINCSSSSPTIMNCTIVSNTSSSYSGGGIHCDNSSPAITNCTIISNTSSYYGGGGIHCDRSSPTITNCTIANNTSGTDGGGLYCTDDSRPTITNCILWGDSPQEVYVESGLPTITYSDIEGGWKGEGNLDMDPGFRATDDYHLLPGSPCIDAGDPSFVAEAGAVDFDGEPRVMHCRVDMGVDEFTLPDPLPGDFDGSGELDMADLVPFVEALLGPTVSDACIGDLTGDASLDGLDIAALVDALLGS